ncbi:MAG: leucine-rich repeat domain-containing protein [Lachnospiraceae bacterium]|nr:leucine-rich repeat domain-containing protein [Lachnospiraceae bacterium]
MEFEYRIRNEKAYIVSCRSDEPMIRLPDELGGAPLAGICSYAFSGRGLKYIVFNEGLETIEDHAFSECRNIKKLTFPPKLKSIGNYAFYNCLELGYVHFTPYISNIGYGAFKNDEKISEIIQDKLPGEEISIGSLLDDLNQRIHVEIRHIQEDGSLIPAKVIFPEHYYELVANVASMCKQFETTEIGSGKYMRYCVGISDIDYAKYDGMFYVLLRGDPFETVITVASERLMYPYALNREAKDTYTEYIRDNAFEAGDYFLKTDDIEKLRFLIGLEVLTEEVTDRLIDISTALGRNEATSLLMACRHRNFRKKKVSFEL